MNAEEKALRLVEYVDALEDERRKIQVFQRELPLCLQLVTQAIESIKQQIGCVEASSDGVPVLEEFMPLKPSSSSSQEEENRGRCEEKQEKKPDWLRSVQLWNQEPEVEPAPEQDVVKKPVALDAMKRGGAFHPFERGNLTPAPAATPVAAASSSAETNAKGGGADNDKEGHSQSHRKARRCWSPDLHRRFLHALQQLGGSHAATPKQIRELMKVDGLTNDEVKSHLQKYRLHTRRPTPAVQQSSSSSSPNTPQFVVVGGIWIQPPEYAAAASQPGEKTAVTTNRIYAPVATLPSEMNLKNRNPTQKPPMHLEVRGSHDDNSVGDDGAMNSASPSTSSSSQTTTASPH